MLADSGAGSETAPFELVLDNNDCLACAGHPMGTIQLGGAYTGPFPLYELRVFILNLGFSKRVRAVGVPTAPPNFDGIAGFRFVNRFTYGNFANKAQFGLEL
jgi:hypothetical protein